MRWHLVKEKDIQYFQFRWQDNLLLYSTKYGQEQFLEKFKPVFLRQMHTNIIVDIDKNDTPIGDGLITKKGIGLGVKIADCLPVYLFCRETICIIHCGWRSILKGIVQKAAQLLKKYQYCLGASIGPCCYEIKEDVAKFFIQDFPRALIHRKGKIFLDLKNVVITQLGKKRLIDSLDYCTKCYPEYFYSFRRSDRKTRNYGVILKLRKSSIRNHKILLDF